MKAGGVLLLGLRGSVYASRFSRRADFGSPCLKLMTTKETAMKHLREFWLVLLALGVTVMVAIAPASAQQQLEGRVLGAGAPIANATVTLFAAGSGAPAQLSRTESGADGHFTLRFAPA